MSASSTDNTTILIVGAGLAGLSLAQALKHANPPIPFRVFERDSSDGFRAQGYRLRIMPNGASALRDLLPAEKWHEFESTCAPVSPGFGSRINAATGRPPVEDDGTQRRGPPPGMQGGKSYNADRAVLRNLLLDGVEEHVTFGKKFVGYEIAAEDGSVRVRFADGSTCVGRLLVGADGNHSAVRQTLLPGLVVLDAGGRAVFGKTPYTPEIVSNVPADIAKGMCLTGMGRDASIKMLSDPMVFSKQLDASLRNRLDMPNDYIYWVLSFRKDDLPSQDLASSALGYIESCKLSLDMTLPWHESLRHLLQHQHVDASSTLSFSICVPESLAKQWKSLEVPDSKSPGNITLAGGPVTLIGDAAHPLTPVGAVGANTAFQDARDLYEAARALKSNIPPAEGIIDAVRGYQARMVARAVTVVEQSILGAGHFFGMKPIEDLIRENSNSI